MNKNSNIVLFANNLPELKKIPDKYYDVAFVDAPYGLGAVNMRMGTANRNGKLYQSTAQKVKKRIGTGAGSDKLKNRAINKYAVNWDDAPPTKHFWNQVFRVSKIQIIFGANYYDLPPSRGIIFWDKLQNWDNFSQFELIWTNLDFPAKKYEVSNTGGSNRKTKIHPTEKPIRLYDRLFKDFVKPGMRVIDTNVGSGNSRISAWKNDIEYLGFENNKQHFKDQENNFKEFQKELRIPFVENIPTKQLTINL
jgi:site-specific DNA-methyltransferase (adenine-specific)